MKLSKLFSSFSIFALLLALIPGQVLQASAVSPDIVISQVYGGGGNSGATYTHDFIELFNRGTSPVSLAGWSVQYASATGAGNFGANSGQLTELPSISLAPGQYLLIQEATNAAVGAPLPAPDVIDATPISMAAGAGKVALVNSTTSLGCNGGSTPCSPAQLAMIIDLVGYGNANFFEGSGPAPTISATLADFRNSGGCTDTDNNAADFTAATPAPRNTASPLNPCSTELSLSIDNVSANEGNSGTTSFDFTVSLSAPAGAGGVTFDIATADDTATVADNDYAANSLTGQTIPEGSFSYTFSVLVNGDTTEEPDETFFVNVTNVTGATVGDGQGLGTILNDDTPISGGDVVISQIYGGGGNTGATYKNDFIELYNRTAGTINLTGWSVQYASATGSTWQVTTLSGSILPGGYYLIQEGAGAGGTVDLPTPQATGNIAMSATAGKVALVNNSAALSGTCPTGFHISDFVGYGTAANCFEGSGPAPAPSNTNAILRADNGDTDTDNNAADFAVGAPNPRNAPPPPPALSIDDVSFFEGNSGTTTFTFTVSLSSSAGEGGVTFDIATADDTATVFDNDYVAKTLTGQTIPEGSSTYTFDVSVNGDTTDETDETFFVNVTSVTGADVVDGQGQGEIVNDDGDFCSLPGTPIYSIQGSGPSAAITGNVITRGVVVGDFEGPTGLLGFYIQDASGDGDPATSDGIFVFTGGADTVSVGDLVKVRGFARERFNQTAINGSNDNNSAVLAGNIADCGTGSVAPVDVEMPFDSSTYLERFEGMLVRFPQALVISEYFNYDRFGEIVLGLPLEGQTRHFTPTGVVEPGADAQALAAAYNLRRITLDDGLGIQNPSFTRHPNGDAFTLENRFRGGDTLQNTVGVLGFDFGLYRIQPTGPAEYTSVNPRPDQPNDVGGNLKVASFNVLNYFTTLDYPTGDPRDNKCGPLQNQECRGADADQPDEFTRQRDKIIAALSIMNADVVGLIEIENHPEDVPTADLVNGLNDVLGTGTYDYIATGAIGTDAIRVAFIYKPATVTPLGAHAVLDTSVDPRFLDNLNRPVLAQTFQDNTTGGIFTVAVNHLKSKGSDCNAVGDPDTGDGQGNCNLTRLAAAQALVDWLATDPTGSGDEDFLIIGDLNSYDKEDPIDAILADGYTDLLFHFLGEYAYSYVFDGQAGYLDHALANAGLMDEVTGATVWHINADEADLIDYDTSFKSDAQDAIYAPDAYRSSDHDPVIVGLDVCDEIAPTFDEVSVTPDVLWPPNHRYVDVTATVIVSDNFDPNPTITLVSVTSNEPDNDPGPEDGNTTNDIVIVDDFNFQLRAERSDIGTGRIYTITYMVTDACGNSTTQSVTVTVPLQLGD